ncbi:MAG: indolepyruvate oxidoreductase subunit beta [Clostridiaceae bacterium]|jgi:indolepyruvate ferredoxin oxidoreductase beta subunit|nr:indolepyruvate oxidoreductase subunit beta [Clostridiaceae bacterium]
MNQSTNIMIVGVGGQGTLLASRILGNVAINSGYDVKVSEVHGMSQRGGSVVTYVKYGKEVFSPVISEGEADIILAFEQLEAYRYFKFLKNNGVMLVNIQKIDPMPVITGAARYPDEIINKLKNTGADITEVDALQAANKAGNAKTANVVLIGLLASKTNIPKGVWENAIQQTVPQNFLDVNKKAFEIGYNGGVE